MSNELAPVENEDVATFTATFANGAVGTFSASRVAHNLPDGLAFELFASRDRPPSTCTAPASSRSPATTCAVTSAGPRRVLIGPDHPYIRGGLPMDAGGVGHGVADLFAYQARAFLDQIAGIGDLGPLPSFAQGCGACGSSRHVPNPPNPVAPPSRSLNRAHNEGAFQ